MENNAINSCWWEIKCAPRANQLLLLVDSTWTNWIYVSSNDVISFNAGKIKSVPVQNGVSKKIIPTDYSWWKSVG